MRSSRGRAPRRLLAVLAVGAAWGLVLTLVAASSEAKELSAGCPVLDGLRLRAARSLEMAAMHRQRGSALGAYQVLHAAVVTMVRDAASGHCGAVERTLQAALKRAARADTARDAVVELELGLDAVDALAQEGHRRYRSAPPKFVPVPEAALYGQDCPDLFPLTLRLEGPAPTLPARVDGVLADLRARPRCAPVRRLLESSPPERLAHAVDSIRLDEPDGALASEDASLALRCPELPLVLEALADAISVGAPQFNAGDVMACQRTYEATVRLVTREVVGPERCPGVRVLLGLGLARATAAHSAKEAAWALRFSFDAVLSGGGRAAP